MSLVKVNPSGRTFTCEGKQTILEAALAASVSLPYGCSMGTCGQCQTRLLEGEVAKVKHHDFSIKEADRLRGNFLSCAYTPISPNIVIEALEATSSADIPKQRINARVKGLAKVSPDIAVLSVQTPRSDRLRFLPGQNVHLTLDDGMDAKLPIASCPCDDRNLEFHIRRFANDTFSCFLFDQTKFPLPVRIDGPWGHVENNVGDGSIICVGFDTHIAAIKSWIEQQLADETEHRIDLFWFAKKQDFYLSKLFESWSDAFDSFTYKLITVQDSTLNLDISAVLSGVLNQSGATMVFVAGPDHFSDQVKQYLHETGKTGYTLWVHSIKVPDRL